MVERRPTIGATCVVARSASHLQLWAMEDLLNGGETPGYRWGQTLEEVTVHIDVGPGVRAKELVVDIKRTSVRVAKKAEPDAAPLLHGDLQQPVLASESTWMLSDGVLQLTLAKDIRRAANVLCVRDCRLDRRGALARVRTELGVGTSRWEAAGGQQGARAQATQPQARETAYGLDSSRLMGTNSHQAGWAQRCTHQ